MSNENIGWTRTTVNAAVAAVVVWLLSNTNWFDFLGDIDGSSPWVMVVVPAVAGVVWRVSMLLTQRWPSLGWALFGVRRQPDYPPPPPPSVD